MLVVLEVQHVSVGDLQIVHVGPFSISLVVKKQGRVMLFVHKLKTKLLICS